MHHAKWKKPLKRLHTVWIQVCDMAAKQNYRHRIYVSGYQGLEEEKRGWLQRGTEEFRGRGGVMEVLYIPWLWTAFIKTCRTTYFKRVNFSVVTSIKKWGKLLNLLLTKFPNNSLLTCNYCDINSFLILLLTCNYCNINLTVSLLSCFSHGDHKLSSKCLRDTRACWGLSKVNDNFTTYFTHFWWLQDYSITFYLEKDKAIWPFQGFHWIRGQWSFRSHVAIS